MIQHLNIKHKFTPILIALLLLTFSFSNCKGRKKIVQEEIKLKPISATEIMDSMKNALCQHTWINSKANARFIVNKNDNEVKANIKMKVDSAIWVSLSKMGVPAFTGLVSRDSVKFLTKIGAKQYFMDDFSKINEMLDAEIDYLVLEDFFKGQPIAFDFDEEYKITTDNGLYLLSSQKSKRINKMIKKNKPKGDELLYRCWVTPKTYKCSRIVVNLIADEVTIEVNYSNWTNINGCLFPMKSVLEFKSQNTKIVISLDYTKVEFNTEQTMPFNFTDSYIKIELKDLLSE